MMQSGVILQQAYHRGVSAVRLQAVRHRHSGSWWRTNNRFQRYHIYTASVLGCLGTVGVYVNNLTKPEVSKHVHLPAVYATEREFTTKQVADHKSPDTGIWVTYGSDVFDITDFVDVHPGGEHIMMAAGGSLEPYWNMFTVHHQEETLDLLQTMKIGKVIDKLASDAHCPIEDQYINDPVRHQDLIVNIQKPFDADPTPSSIARHYITPNDLFYVRNHFPVPKIDPNTYRLEIAVDGKPPLELSLNDLKTKFEKRSIVVTLQCAGNRRNDMAKVKPLYGSGVGFTKISNAEWTGVSLADVLEAAGYTRHDYHIRHVRFKGLDQDFRGVPYACSIPIEKAWSPSGDVILAYEMNGEPLPPDHGYPLRVVVPGVIGARSLKWLGKITATEQECDCSYQQVDYKTSPPSANGNNFNFRDAPAINELPVTSAVCEPVDGAKVKVDDGQITINGYAFSGGGNGILRVDVSLDGGHTWHSADLQQAEQRLYRKWAWTLWQISLPVPDDAKSLEIVCKAVDTCHNVQPDTARGIWNIRGYLSNSWHHVKVDLR